MDDTDKLPTDLQEVLIRMLSNEATGSEVASLDKALKHSPELRAQAAQFLCDESLLSELCVTQRQADDILFLRNSPRRPAENNSSPQSPRRATSANSVLTRINRHGLAIGAVAALVIVAFAVYTAVLNRQLSRLHDLAVVTTDSAPSNVQKSRRKGGRNSKEPATEVVGRVAGLDAPVWKEGTTGLSFGDRITKGQTIELESGVVELLLSTGAKLTVEGPARLEAHSALESFLERGRLAAAAPRVARGYTVITPTAELVDIGTQFGVKVEDTGDSELHVFDGDVVARSRLSSKGAGTLIHAKQDEAMRFDSVSADPQRFTARETDFVRHVNQLYDPSELPNLPTTTSLAQWYTADTCKAVAGGNQVGTWNDLLVGDNGFADNAWQFDELRRPELVQDGAGRAALKFDGWSTCMVTSPVEGSDKQTVFVVLMPAPIAYDNTQLLYMFGMEPTLEIAVLTDFTARGWVWPGTGKSAAGEIHTTRIDNSKPAVLVYQYDTTQNVSKCWLNGVLQGQGTAATDINHASQRFIGIHRDMHAAFFGNLYEIAVFNDTFSDDQLDEFWAYFSQRYGIELP
ncbi:hypothetical protein [Aeoliella sp.]|uniref:hypothetical protein n=1 Tax=Aeoliella sp. TaxID=2795800 RepID=UPI003CCBD08E